MFIDQSSVTNLQIERPLTLCPNKERNLQVEDASTSEDIKLWNKR